MGSRRRLLVFGALFLLGVVMHWAPPDWNPFIVFPGMLLEIVGVVGILVTLVRSGAKQSYGTGRSNQGVNPTTPCEVDSGRERA